MIHLLPLMLERVGIIVIIAFLLSQIKSFRQIIQTDRGVKGKWLLVAIFGAFGIVSNYTGIEIKQNALFDNTWLMDVDPDNAIASTRNLGVGIGGLLGGPFVGFGVGMIAGIHRYTLGGFTAGACAVSSILTGIVAGYIGKRYKKRHGITPWFAVGVGMAMETVQMLIILAFTKPFEKAWTLVEIIGVPMVIMNGLGILIFMYIIQSILREEERTRALQTHNAFMIADRTLPFFRRGLNKDSCMEVANIMLQLTEADAVAITNDHRVLAHIGAASDHHIPGKAFVTGLTKDVLNKGTVMTTRKKEEIFCFHDDCPLQAAVVLPLKVHEKTAGTLKMYFTNPEKLDRVEQELAEGLARLFSTQLELAEAELQSELLKNAEIKALQAQVHPHFLFNSINTISALCRTDIEKARKLLVELGIFFRSNLQGARQFIIPLEKELEYVRAYLSLEQARFPHKYHVSFRIEPGVEKALIPPFTIQPLVENAVLHAFSKIKEGGVVDIHVCTVGEGIHITVEDNGKGMTRGELEPLGKKTVKSSKGTGTAIYNISKRLEGIYNMKAAMHIHSKVNAGTKIEMIVPLKRSR
ncbi:sensor histidine kinase [Domibacillus epiphyticus]|uniref:histidine kinase n=1 Tax=Domibacillus epiphyticus TaxID=1714355 RepID=A0A1V2A7Q0_9BACI|nr:sensor histidine kinase [Domibacillus epiphyticus]OMP67031.1 sensor histidine kinase [Domibacillus epiphyticus]